MTRLPPAKSHDLCPLAVQCDSAGEGCREFTAAVGELSESDRPFLGPRTTHTAPLQRHHWWRTVLRLDGEAAWVDHWAISQVLETALLNISDMACVEIQARRFQLVEETHGLRLRERHSFDLGVARNLARRYAAPPVLAWECRALLHLAGERTTVT